MAPESKWSQHNDVALDRHRFANSGDTCKSKCPAVLKPSTKMARARPRHTAHTFPPSNEPVGIAARAKLEAWMEIHKRPPSHHTMATKQDVDTKALTTLIKWTGKADATVQTGHHPEAAISCALICGRVWKTPNDTARARGFPTSKDTCFSENKSARARESENLL